MSERRARGLRRTALALLLIALPPSPLWAAPPPAGGPPGWCGTGVTRLAESWARHRRFRRHLRARGASRGVEGSEAVLLATEAGPSVRVERSVAVIEDDGTLVSERNLFDLADRALRFERRRGRLRAVPADISVDPDLGTRLSLEDDDSAVVDLAFTFPLYGRNWNRVHVNSDGSLTFGAPDTGSSERSLARVLSGPPRIAPLFADLDPGQTEADRGVFARSGPSTLKVTWAEVPEWGSSNANTFQVVLFSSGRIEIAYGEVDAQQGVVGISPGGGAPLELLDFSDELPFGPSDFALLERFSSSPEVDDMGVARTFLRHFPDAFDALVVWLDFPQDLDGAFAFELNLRNQISGIGLPQFDISDVAGSDGRLESFLQMGSLGRYPSKPRTNVLGTNSTLDLLGHETGHRWLAFTRFRDSRGQVSDALLGRDSAHWSFFLDSDASVLEGNNIRENGDGTFTTVSATARYSALDQYLMGLIPPEQVGPFFLVAGNDRLTRDASPRIGVTFTGTRVDVTVDQVIAAEGARRPDSAESPTTYHMAFILLGRAGEPPSTAAIAQVAKIRRKWRGYFNRATSRRARVVTALRPPAE